MESSKDIWEAVVAKAGASGELHVSRRTRLTGRKRDKFYVAPALFRDWDAVDSDLRAVFASLCSGKALWPLYLWGTVGTGKTRAVFALCDSLETARYWTVDDLMFLMDSRTERNPPWLDSANGAPRTNDWPQLAVLDEIGLREKVSDWEYSAVKRFADWREDRPAIYVSNHPPAVIGRKYDERVESRLSCGTVFELTGPDRRHPTAAAVPATSDGARLGDISTEVD